MACPSLSPDGTETPLAERESIDDQIEWLDNQHVLYGKKFAVWIANADGSGQPLVFVPNADSPSVVRPAPASPT